MDFNYNNYIDKVINKEIITCDAIYRAVKRHVDDIEKSSNKDFLFYFDKHEAEKLIIFIQSLKHTKGKWAADYCVGNCRFAHLKYTMSKFILISSMA